MSMSDKDSIYCGFEAFANYIIEENLKMTRTNTEAFLENDGLQTVKMQPTMQNNLAAKVKGMQDGDGF